MMHFGKFSVALSTVSLEFANAIQMCRHGFDQELHQFLKRQQPLEIFKPVIEKWLTATSHKEARMSGMLYTNWK